MPVRIRVETAPGQWLKEIDEKDANVVKAANKALRDLGIIARDAGRRAIAGAAFGSVWTKSLQLIMYPKGRAISTNPTAYLHSTINYADVFETGKHVQAQSGHYLWMPLPHVPPFKGRGVRFGGVVGRSHMTPKQFIRFVGPLVFVHPKGRKPMLCFPVPGRGKTVTAAKVRRAAARIARGESEFKLVPMYIGVTSIEIPRKFDATAAMNKVLQEGNLADLYLRELDKLEKAKEP